METRTTQLEMGELGAWQQLGERESQKGGRGPREAPSTSSTQVNTETSWLAPIRECQGKTTTNVSCSTARFVKATGTTLNQPTEQ